jgi:hypothetical protein
MKTYVCRWPNHDLALICARNRQEARLVSAPRGLPCAVRSRVGGVLV